eukprot:m.53208 g.53208  ORF g.53208 m.53208 type:complete len:357 (+) comp15438_c0_seq8:43-1113(+)
MAKPNFGVWFAGLAALFCILISIRFVNQLQADILQMQAEFAALKRSIAGTCKIPGKAPPNMINKEKKTDVQVSKSELQYGGLKDADHLGGFTSNDTQGQSTALWNFLIKGINVKSVVDVGCGRGISTKWFLDHGADVLCIEGSSDAVEQSLLPADRIVQHDFYMGPYWPDKTYDFAWSVEFLEHIGRQYMKNYLPIFEKSAIIFATHSLWGGYHHVEVHDDWWWITRMEMQGFVYSEPLTSMFRAIARRHVDVGAGAQHLWLSGMAFLNPRVASLPEHHHLIGMHGCVHNKKLDRHRENFGKKMEWPCRTPADHLPEEYLPVNRRPNKWDNVTMDPSVKHFDKTRDMHLYRVNDGF